MCGGFVGDILDGVGDLVEGVADVVGDVVEGVVDVVQDIGSGIDDFVNDVIPGGWAGVAGGALLAIGIYNPALLGLAEGGALTTEALTAAGLDAAAVAEGVATVAPEVLAATEAAVASGIAPEVIAMANATLDPIAALSAAQGWTVADTAYLASIGATPELIATATANNAALAAAETAATEGAATSATEGATTGAADGSTTQVFDDGSTLTTGADGNVIGATDSTGANFAPVTDATSVPGAGAGTPDPSLGTALGNYAGAVYDTLGPLGTAGLLGGGAALLGGALTGGGSATGYNGGTAEYTWGQAQPLVNPGLNPGYLGYAASAPDYQTTNPTDAQYYWGVHAPVNTEADLANYNKLPDYAPATPWGAGPTAVGGQASLDIPNFINQYVTNPQMAGVNNATGAGYNPMSQVPLAPIAPTVNPLSLPGPSMAEQALAEQALAAQLTAGPAVPA